MVHVLFAYILRESWLIQEIPSLFLKKGVLMLKHRKIECKSLSEEEQ